MWRAPDNSFVVLESSSQIKHSFPENDGATLSLPKMEDDSYPRDSSPLEDISPGYSYLCIKNRKKYEFRVTYFTSTLTSSRFTSLCIIKWKVAEKKRCEVEKAFFGVSEAK